MFSGLTGIKLSQKGFIKAGERITKLERKINRIMDPEGAIDGLPERFLKEKDTQFSGLNTTVPLDRMIKEYYKYRSV